MVHPPKRGYVTANQLIFSISHHRVAIEAAGRAMSLKDFALKGQDGGNGGQHRRCARGGRCPHNNATLKRVA